MSKWAFPFQIWGFLEDRMNNRNLVYFQLLGHPLLALCEIGYRDGVEKILDTDIDVNIQPNNVGIYMTMWLFERFNECELALHNHGKILFIGREQCIACCGGIQGE